MREAGLGIGGWACNDAEAIARLLALQVDVFTTDRPGPCDRPTRPVDSRATTPVVHMPDGRGYGYHRYTGTFQDKTHSPASRSSPAVVLPGLG